MYLGSDFLLSYNSLPYTIDFLDMKLDSWFSWYEIRCSV